MKSWPHAPLHLFNEKGTYMVTASSLNKTLYFQQNEELDFLHDSLLELAEAYGWRLEAWVIFSNHYHFVAQSPDDSASLRKFISHLHSASARKLNILHQTPGRKIWHQYWDSRITFQNSYLARLNYVMQNPVKHKIVTDSRQYKWCSANWFEQNVSKAHYETVRGFHTDSIKVIDDF